MKTVDVPARQTSGAHKIDLQQKLLAVQMVIDLLTMKGAIGMQIVCAVQTVVV